MTPQERYAYMERLLAESEIDRSRFRLEVARSRRNMRHKMRKMNRPRTETCEIQGRFDRLLQTGADERRKSDLTFEESGRRIDARIAALIEQIQQCAKPKEIW